MNQVVVATSPFHDVSVTVGPFRSPQRCKEADEKLTAQGWNTEVCDLVTLDDVPTVANDEGL